MNMVPVIDISRWQGAVDFVKMRSHGVVGVIIRLGNGVTLDARAETYVRGARSVGMTVGGYWFMNPKASVAGAEQGRRLVQRADELDAHDIPVMLDVENYANEPGAFPSLRGRVWLNWLVDAANIVTRLTGRDPIVYTNNAYMVSVGINDVRDLGRCPLLVARYPWYTPTSPQPPADATQWETWVYANTIKRPQVPGGWSDWDGWQWSAGYNRMGRVYGAESADIDLNLIKADAWRAWTGAASPVHVETQPGPLESSLLLTPTPYHPEDDMAGNAPLIKMDKRYNEAFLVGAGTPVWLTGQDVEALKQQGVVVADSDPHDSFSIVAERAGCTSLTRRG